MEGLAICHRGLEPVARDEIKEILGLEASAGESVLSFRLRKREQLAELCYRAQSLTKVLFLLGKAEVNNHLEESLVAIKAMVSGAELGSWLKGRTFKVHCARVGGHDYSSQDIASRTGEFVLGQASTKVSVTEPEVIVYVYIRERECYLGIDYAGFDLSRRHYKVFSHTAALNASVAYGLVRMAAKGKGLLLDPFCGSGTIPIEAALYSVEKSPHFFVKDRFMFHRLEKVSAGSWDRGREAALKIKASDHLLGSVKATKNNAKLAGVEFSVTRMDIEWLDTKLDRASADWLVTNPPSESRLHDAKHLQKLYRELFYQAEYVLKSKGTVLLCTEKEPLLSDSSKFSKVQETEIWQGAQRLRVCMLRKNI